LDAAGDERYARAMRTFEVSKVELAGAPRTAPTVPNRYMTMWQQNFAKPPLSWQDTTGPDMLELPGGLASAPVELTDLRTGLCHDLRFVAGMFGVVEDAAGTLSPEFGWAITYAR
jgi:hypothetical protein